MVNLEVYTYSFGISVVVFYILVARIVGFGFRYTRLGRISVTGK